MHTREEQPEPEFTACTLQWADLVWIQNLIRMSESLERRDFTPPVLRLLFCLSGRFGLRVQLMIVYYPL